MWRRESEQTMRWRVSLPMVASKPCGDWVTTTVGSVGID
jgi:hypothetical protein